MKTRMGQMMKRAAGAALVRLSMDNSYSSLRNTRMQQQPAFVRHVLLRLAVCALITAGFATASINAWACQTLSIVVAQPVDNGVLKVSRIAGAHAGLPDTWDMRYDVWICNPTSGAITVSSVKIEHLSGSTVTKTVSQPPDNQKTIPASIPASSTNQLVIVRDDTLYPFPLPTSIRFTFALSTGAKLVQTYPVAEHTDPGPLHAFFFPFREAGLAAGTYWFQNRHEEDNTFQRWAYDLEVGRWDGSKWTNQKPGTDGTHNTDMLSFDQPVYAMSDGRVIGCNRGGRDNDPPDKCSCTNPPGPCGNVPGGNVLWVRTGDETQLYAHLKQNSIPSSLCPFSDDAEHQLANPDPNIAPDPAYVIHAGQPLGHTGESGCSQDTSHIHIHTFMGLPAIWGGSETGIDADARPLEFVNLRVQEIPSSSNVNPSSWNQVTSSGLLPYNTIVQGNDCGFDPSAAVGKPEVINLGVPGNCFLEMTNAMWQAGLRPTSIDVHGVNGSSISSTVWRPAGGIANVILAGLSDVELDTARETWVVNNGFRFRQVEAYVEGGVMKHAVIFEKGTAGGAQIMQRNIDIATLTNLSPQNPGYVPVNISAVVVNGVTRFDALMEEKNVGSLIVNVAIPIADYQNELTTQSNAGRNLAYIDGYDSGGNAFISAIWYGNLSTTVPLSDKTAIQVQDAETTNLTAGRFLQGVTAYMTGNNLLYAAFWRSGS
jgi:hypothetical protein